MYTARVLYRHVKRGCRAFLIPTLAVVFLLFLTVGKADAQTGTYYPPVQTPQYIAPNTNSNVPQNQHTFIQSIAIESLATGICLLSGYDILSPTHRCLGIDPYTQRIGFAPLPATADGKLSAGGALGGMSSMIGTLYTHPPVSSVEYVRYMAGKFGFGEKAYAQAGFTGYSNLYDLRFLWREFRNIAYVIMVIAFILIGIAVMLRVRIDPRTVMTVQNQIPKIIIGILLITFSYAIAGFMVDIMWVATYFGINAVATNKVDVLKPAIGHIVDNPVYFFHKVIEGGVWGVSKNIGESLADIIILEFASTGNCISGGALPPWDVNWDECLGSVLQWIGKWIMTFIVLAAILIALVRLWFTLLKAYAFIILDVIAAPLWIAAGAIPGSSLNFSSWFRHLTAHLLLFPAAATIIVLARTLQERFLHGGLSGSGSTKYFFTPPLIGNPAAPEAFINLIVLAIILMLPELLTILRDALRSKPLPYTSKIGPGFMAGAGAAAGIASIPKEAYKMRLSAKTPMPGGGTRGWKRTVFGV